MKPLLLSVALACVALPAQAAQVVSNETLGIRAVMPDGWHVLTAEANAENLARVEMRDRQLQDALERYAAAPVIAFTKYREPHPDLNPSFKVNVRPQGSLVRRSAVEILSVIMPTLEDAFDDVFVQQRPVAVTVAGQPAAYTRLTYTLRAGGKGFPTTSELWIVPRGSYFFMIGAGTRTDERNGTRAEVRRIVDSLTFSRVAAAGSSAP